MSLIGGPVGPRSCPCVIVGVWKQDTASECLVNAFAFDSGVGEVERVRYELERAAFNAMAAQ